ncbi:WYL domain-containing protein, partial [Mycobacterium tuberculosis]|nr:WYL domain-containing protein [Mycobacterium tuberculosis]
DTLVGPVAEVDADVLVRLAHACLDAVLVRFRYAGRVASDTERTVEPVRMVATSHRWYLMAWDVDRADWRTFRLDRMRDLVAT